MQLEEGKFYRRRDGGKVGPIKRRHPGNDAYPWVGPNGLTYTATGRFLTGSIRGESADLVAEWSDKSIEDEVQDDEILAIAAGVEDDGFVTYYPHGEPRFQHWKPSWTPDLAREALGINSDPPFDFKDASDEPEAAPLTDQFDAALSKATNVTADRGAIYGHPADDFARAAGLKAVVAECDDDRIRHVLDMICTKMARLIHTPDHLDSWIDIAGYARTAVMVLDREGE